MQFAGSAIARKSSSAALLVPKSLQCSRIFQVVETIIKPETAASRCRYIDLPHMQQHKMPPGGTYYFVSHSWNNPFHELVDAVQSHLINAVASSVRVHVNRVSMCVYV